MRKICAFILSIVAFFTNVKAENSPEEIVFPIQNHPLPVHSDTLRVLLIGNSFTYDLTTYIGDILRKSGINNNSCCVYILWSSGASLQYWSNWYEDKNIFKITKMGGNLVMDVTEGTVQEILSQNWDVVGLQQTSNYTTKRESYHPYLEKMITHIKHDCTNKSVSLCWHLTWSYWEGYDVDGPKEETGWKEILVTAEDEVVLSSGIDIVIPSGTAIENARRSILNTPHSLTRDGRHISYGIGQYILACTLFETIFAPVYGKSILENTAYPVVYQKDRDEMFEYADVTKETAYVSKLCAISAVKNRNEVTIIDSLQTNASSFSLLKNVVSTNVTIHNNNYEYTSPIQIDFSIVDVNGHTCYSKKTSIQKDYSVDV
ncbi:MAG: DUF4886 domain-containing protein, partial [Bacteroidales bacterium]|nr:DUF4886 domain-containing protein [Bacteroidales bacterium]